jgi:cytochrome c5
MTLPRLLRVLPLVVALSACVEAPPIPPADASRDVQEGHRLFMAKCTLCHDPVQPAEHAAAKWPKLLDKYGIRARLKPEEKADILAYVTQYSQ